MLQPRKNLTNFSQFALVSWIPSPQVVCLTLTPLDSDLQWRIPTTLPTLIGICIRESPWCLSSSRLERCNPLWYKFRLASNHEAIRSATVRLCSSHLCCPPLAVTFHATLYPCLYFLLRPDKVTFAAHKMYPHSACCV